MSLTNTSFIPLWLEGGKCPNDKRHFRGAAREVYGYLRLLARRHGGFVFASVPNITKHTKKWADKNGKTFSQRQYERMLRTFQVLGILGPRTTLTIHKRRYSGWQFYEHDSWAERSGGMCEFKLWELYEASYPYLMGNKKLDESNPCGFKEENVGINDGAYDGINDGDSTENVGTNVGANVGMLPNVSASNPQESERLQATGNP